MDSKTRYSLIMLIALLIWMSSRLVVGNDAISEVAPPADTTASVRVARFSSEPVDDRVDIRATTEPFRRVSVAAQIGGLIEALPVNEGTRVSAGQTLCQIADQGRTRQLQQARSALTKAELDHKGALKLRASNLQSDSAIAASQAALDAARSALEQAELAVSFLQIKAPFDGLFETRSAELGQLMSPGAQCGVLISNQPLKVVGQVSEYEVARLKPGQQAVVRLADGRAAMGEVSYVAAMANTTTRTFQIELQIDNPKGEFVAGQTALAEVAVGVRKLHQVPSQLLTLNTEGSLGLRGVEGDKVVFYPVALVRDTGRHALVDGLPEVAELITVGHEYVSPGQQVAITEDTDYTNDPDTQQAVAKP